MVEISELEKSFLSWFSDKPLEVRTALANRIALRLIPMATGAFLGVGKSPHALEVRLLANLFRTVAVSRSILARGDHSAGRSAARKADHAADAARNSFREHSTGAWLDKGHAAAIAIGYAGAEYGVIDGAAAACAYSASEVFGENVIWQSLETDFRLLEDEGDDIERLMRAELWISSEPSEFDQSLSALNSTLDTQTDAWSEWSKWYGRRLKGEPSEWGLRPKGDIEIARRIIEAGQEFWEEGEENPAFVNSQLTEWLDELRLTSVNLELPPQQSGVTNYSSDAKGRVTRSEPTKQDHLKDVPAQRRKYQDIRETASEMLEDHGQQRLGRRLNKDLERLGAALPKEFENAEAYPVWLAIRKLNARLEKHDIATQSFDPDPNRLDELCVVDLRELLDLASNFAFDDDGLRANDERTIPPQKRVSLDVEADIGTPLVNELQGASNIVTEEVSEDLIQGTEVIEDANTGSFDDQLVESAVVQRRNVFAALFGGLRDRFTKEGKKTGSEVRKGVEKEAGKAGLAFLSRNWDAIKTYIGVAYRSNANRLIEWLSGLF